jgi:hypothetical protein
MDEDQMLVMMVPAGLKDEVIDTLITLDGISGFNMTTLAGFSREHSQYDLGEQVEGYRQLFKFEVLHRRRQRDDLLGSLRPVCASANIRYWVLPVAEQGHI